MADVSDLMRRMVKRAAAEIQRQAAVPGADRLHRAVQALRRGSTPVQVRHGIRTRRVQPRRGARERRARRHGRLRADDPATPPRLLSRKRFYQSLRRRRERLESRRRELEALQRGGQAATGPALTAPELDAADIEDLDDAPEQEVEDTEARILDQATAAQSIVELKAEISDPHGARTARARRAPQRWGHKVAATREPARRDLHGRRVGRPGWRARDAVRRGRNSAACALAAAEARALYGAPGHAPLSAEPNHDASRARAGGRRHPRRNEPRRPPRSTGGVPARPGSAGAPGDRRRRRGNQPPTRAPDGELRPPLEPKPPGAAVSAASTGLVRRKCVICGISSRTRTREGDVYRRLLEKLEQARQTMGGQVFDVLGKLEFEGRPLRELLLDAIRYGEQPEVRARLDTAVDQALDRSALQDLLEERQLAHDAMDARHVHRVRGEMERADARRLQPHYIESFFREAFRRAGGSARQREPRRYELTHVPAPVRTRNRQSGPGEPVLPRYERIAFDKALVAPPDQPLAAFVCPGHPLLDAVIDLTLERHRDLLQRGTVLLDERDGDLRPRVLFFCRACPSGRQRHANGRSTRHLQARAVRRARRRRRHAPPAICAVSRLPAAGRRRAGDRRYPRSIRVRLDRQRSGTGLTGVCGGRRSSPNISRRSAAPESPSSTRPKRR